MNRILSLCLLTFCLFCIGESNHSSEWLYLTANNFINQICIDGIKQPLPVTARVTRRMGKLQLPDSWTSVNIKAANRKGFRGILAYIKRAQPAGLQWKCKPLSLIPNRACCNWDGSKGSLKASAVFKPFNGLIPSRYPRAWIWSHGVTKSVCCKMTSCPAYCRNCRKNGPNQCDSCLPGSKYDAATKLCTSCPSLCARCRKNGPDQCDTCIERSLFNSALKLCEKICQLKIDMDNLKVFSRDVNTHKQYVKTLTSGNREAVIINVRTCNYGLNHAEPMATEANVDTSITNWDADAVNTNLVFLDIGIDTSVSVKRLTGTSGTIADLVPAAVYRTVSVDIVYSLGREWTAGGSKIRYLETAI